MGRADRVLVELTRPQLEALCAAAVEWETNHEAHDMEGYERPDRRLAPTMDRAYRALRAAVDPLPLPMVPPPELNRTAGSR